MASHLTRARLVNALLACFIAGGLLSGVTSISPRAAVTVFTSPLMLPALARAQPGPGPVAGREEPDRTTVLVLGVDRRPVEDPDAPARTDSLLLLSVDGSRQTAAALSIPRDLWVPIPITPDGVVQDRINAAYLLGEQASYPGGGPALTKATVEYNLGVRIHHYVILDFKAFEELIDRIGGVDVTLAAPLVDPAYPTEDYGAMPIRIPAGQQHLDGRQALWFARSRYQASDFSRMERQQQLLMAVRDRVLRVDAIPKWPQLWTEQGALVQTDLTLPQALRFAALASEIPKDRITTHSLELGYVVRGAVPGDPFVLFPDRHRIGELVAQLFPDGGR